MLATNIKRDGKINVPVVRAMETGLKFLYTCT